jgi:hypothetical protein
VLVAEILTMRDDGLVGAVHVAYGEG